LNVAGLAAGLTCFLFIALWVNDELSYDKFYTNYNRIFRLVFVEKRQTGITESTMSSAPMATAIIVNLIQAGQAHQEWYNKHRLHGYRKNNAGVCRYSILFL